MNDFERAAGNAANAYGNMLNAKNQAESSSSKYSGKDIQYIGDKLLVMKASGDTKSQEYKELSEWYEKNKRNPNAKYQIGTKNALAGIANVDEIGKELIIRKPDRGRYTRLEAGDGVLPANLTERIFALANNPVDYLIKSMSGLATSNVSNVTNNNSVQPLEIKMGDIIVQGDASKFAVAQLDKLRSDIKDDVFKTINRHNLQSRRLS